MSSYAKVEIMFETFFKNLNLWSDNLNCFLTRIKMETWLRIRKICQSNGSNIFLLYHINHINLPRSYIELLLVVEKIY